MPRKNDSSLAAANGIGRREWTTPRMRRLATSSAAFGAATHVDAEGFS